MMKLFATLIVLAAMLFVVPIMAMDQRDGSNGVPFLKPESELKTTDSFYTAMGATDVSNGVIGYQLPEVFGGPHIPKVGETNEPDWMNLTAHNMKLGNNSIKAASSYALTEGQMIRGNVSLGKENYL